MDKFKKSQILKLVLIVILLSITPLLSESLRPPYLYFVVNLLILALGAEAGLLSFMFKAAEEKKSAATVAQKPSITSEESLSKEVSATSTVNGVVEPESIKKKPKVVEKSHSEKIVGDVKVNKAVKKCPSTPSLFFIGGGETDEATEEFCEDDDQEEVGELTGQELFHKAETFIGNFYKQLKMQREESWKKIHGFYQKAF